jgi:group II intron reverse transcriptase/maturase
MKGTPQGGVISPLLANLFLHYAFDKWIQRTCPYIPFERYADDMICHCRSQAQAKWLRELITQRLAECELALHPQKTKIVYCKDVHRRQDYPVIQFDFLGYTFRPRKSKDRFGGCYVRFLPAVSDKAAKSMRQAMRRWAVHRRTDKSLDDLARMFNPIIRGWIHYYGRFYRSALYRVFDSLDYRLVRWAMQKYKRLRGHQRRAGHWLRRIKRQRSGPFAHWSLLASLAG